MDSLGLAPLGQQQVGDSEWKLTGIHEILAARPPLGYGIHRIVKKLRNCAPESMIIKTTCWQLRQNRLGYRRCELPDGAEIVEWRRPSFPHKEGNSALRRSTPVPFR